MKPKIIGVTVGSPLPKPNLMQTDPTKGDYVKGKEEFLAQIPSGGPVSDEQIENAVKKYMDENPVESGVQFETDEKTLKLENGVLSVNTTNDMEKDNTLPITSAGVYATVGNIEALLKTI
jgi:hypothetical protein